MSLNKIILLLLMMSACNEIENKNLKCHFKVDSVYSNSLKCTIDVVFCLYSAFIEVPSVTWGLKDSKKFKNGDETIEVIFLNREDELPDSVLLNMGKEYFNDIYRNGKINKQFPISNLNFNGILTEFTKDNVTIELFEGFDSKSRISVRILHKMISKNSINNLST